MQMSRIKWFMVLVSSAVLAMLLYVSSHSSTTIPAATEVVRFLYTPSPRLGGQVEAHENIAENATITATSLLGDVSYDKLIVKENPLENPPETTVKPVLSTENVTITATPLLGDVSYDKLIVKENPLENPPETTVKPVLSTENGTTVKGPQQISENREDIIATASHTEVDKAKPYKEKISPGDKYHGRCYDPPINKRVTDPLSADEIAAELSKKFEISDRTLQDIKEAIDLNVISINRSDVDNIKIVLGYHGYEHTPHYTWYNFTHCEYTNCIPLNPHRTLSHPPPPPEVTKAASIILFNLVEMYQGSTLREIPRRPDQYFGTTSLESSGYHFNKMPPALNGQINMTLTYHRKSTVPEWHIFKACMDRRQNKIKPVDYADGKTKGALAYVSNCNSVQYNRLNVMAALGKYIPVDIFGNCGSPDPCSGSGDENCSRDLHKKYRFYLSFENSLCEDYISEKFWDRLSEPAYMLPVAMGGLSVQEYTEQAPENSFLHLRNFTSVAQLGAYLKTLMEDDSRFNAYHHWRESWDVYKRPIYTRFPSCDLCRIANELPYMPADNNLSEKYNDPSHCANYDAFPSTYG